MWDGLLQGLAVYSDLSTVLLLLGGVVLGILVGAIPGLTSTLAISLLLPVTFGMSAVKALVFLVGIFVGGIYGGSMTAIAVRIPGAPANAMTIIDGHPMSQQGKTEAAMGLATFGSTIGGVFGGIALVIAAPQMARMALQFQSPETFALVLLALIAVAGVTGESLIKGLIALVIGLMLSTTGIDQLMGVPRYTWGITDLLVGVPLMPVVLGLFAFTELMRRLEEPDHKVAFTADISYRKIFDFWPYVKQVSWKLFLKSSIIGTVIGALPGGGASMAAFFAYMEAKRSSSRPDQFGKGNPEGILAPETANNAVTGGALIPMLALGIPGDAVTAVMLGGLLIQGIIPGPRLFRESADLISPVFVGYFIAYIMIFVVGMGLLPFYGKLGLIPRRFLFPFVGTLVVVAAYAAQGTFFAIWLTIAIGVLGWLLVRGGYPLIPVLMGVILGPILETNFRRALMVSEGSYLVFVQSPLSIGLLVACAVFIYYFAVIQPRRGALEPGP